ncbi:MAG: hypothetical protein KJ950_06810 [Proteobacteria bacterium]|nr:hypothetical protein [Pseudomonadota bacterium]MBU1686751.1 hypothetical protein [Pseudomonadota bacterium]
METVVGPVPRVATSLTWRDDSGTVRARLGLSRENYRISPGLYCVGYPNALSPILVTANYKLTFDALRCELVGMNCWILALDTRGVNVWCASAHKTFGTEELVRQIKRWRLSDLVEHQEVIVPQLGASGVSARDVKQWTGFRVTWGPIRAADLRTFLRNDKKASAGMRQVTFDWSDRLILSPVELVLFWKPTVILLVALLLLSGIGPDIFSASTAWHRWRLIASAYLGGLLTGTVVVPVLLPWLPFRSFYLKGLLAALPVGLGLVWPYFRSGESWITPAGPLLLCFAVASYAAMNYTGATPYASPSGVEKEMRHAIPVQLFLFVGALFCWLIEPFMITVGGL